MGFFQELKRRNVFRVGLAYVLMGWILLQASDFALDLVDAPNWVIQVFFIAVVIGLPVALFFAWAFEMTPEGLKREKDVDRSQSIVRETGHKLDRSIIVVLLLALGYFVADKFFISRDQDEPLAEAVEQSQEPAAAAEAPPADDKSIAVLPFAHRSPNPDDQYFTDGMHDDLLTQLAKQDAFKVISRTSMMEYRDTTKNLRQIGEELGVRHILEGGVQRAGSRVRINVQLIDAQTDEHLWAETYDRELTTDNLFDIQSEITVAIARELHATLRDSPTTSAAPPTTSLAAFEFYLKAKQITLGQSRSDLEAAVATYQEAIAIDPEFALAHIGLAEAYLTLYWSFEGDLENREASRASIDRAIELAPALPEIQMAEGFYHYWGHLDYARALAHLDRAIQAMPNHAEAHMWRGWALRRDGRWDEAVGSMRRSLELDPRSILNWLEYGQTLGYLHRFEAALASIARAKSLGDIGLFDQTYLISIELQQGDLTSALARAGQLARSTDQSTRLGAWEPFLLARDFEAAKAFAESWPEEFEIIRQAFLPAKRYRAVAFLLGGDAETARADAAEVIAQLKAPDGPFPDDYRKLHALALAHAAAGDRAGTVDLAEQAIASRPRDAVENMLLDYRLSRSLALVGENDRAMALLEPLLQGPSTVSVAYVELDPHWDALRGDPAFIALLDRYRGPGDGR
jgi:TolB-like protein/Tfp pilus assembly protein PilF